MYNGNGGNTVKSSGNEVTMEIKTTPMKAFDNPFFSAITSALCAARVPKI
jgi:hypothetical protein